MAYDLHVHIPRGGECPFFDSAHAIGMGVVLMAALLSKG